MSETKENVAIFMGIWAFLMISSSFSGIATLLGTFFLAIFVTSWGKAFYRFLKPRKNLEYTSNKSVLITGYTYFLFCFQCFKYNIPI